MTWLIGGPGRSRDLWAEFEAHRELIESIASAQFDQISTMGNEVGLHFFETHSGQHSAKVSAYAKQQSGRRIR